MFTLNPIGSVRCGEDGFAIHIDPAYREALTGLDGFDWIQTIWWFDGCDNAQSRAKRVLDKPYVNGPDKMGVFATRSPERPNPIAVTAAYVTGIDRENGIIHIAWTDARDGSPVLDIKPYTPAADRVAQPAVPAWCAHWPGSVEESGEFDWAGEFSF